MRKKRTAQKFQVMNLIAELDPGRIAGTVKVNGSGYEGASIELWNEAKTVKLAETISAAVTGAFTFEDLTPGIYQVFSSIEAFQGWEEAIVVSGKTTLVSFEYSTLVTVFGIVTMFVGGEYVPQEGVTVQIWDSEWNPTAYETFTGPDGSYTLGNLDLDSGLQWWVAGLLDVWFGIEELVKIAPGAVIEKNIVIG